MPKSTPIEQRCAQIEKELDNLRLPKNQKIRKEFKSDENFENWKKKQGEKLLQLNEELIILNDPAECNEIPLAVAAMELGVSLNEMLSIISEDLVATSSVGIYKAGSRITREELARANEIGGQELVRIVNQDIDEIFTDAINFIINGDKESARKAYDRIEKNYSGIDPHAFAVEFGIQLALGNYEEIYHSLDFLARRDNDGELTAFLAPLKKIAEALPPLEFMGEVIKEQISAVADGMKLSPFDRSYSSWESSEYFSQMDENQRHAMLLATVVLSAIQKYNFSKYLGKWSGYSSAPKDEEMERVIRNAIYTALEAESTYYNSPSSKLFVDKYVEFLPKRWVPAQHISILPGNRKK